MEETVPCKAKKGDSFFAKIFDIIVYIIIQWREWNERDTGTEENKERTDRKRSQKGEDEKITQKRVGPPPRTHGVVK